MLIIDLPARPVAAEIDWKPRQPTQLNRAEFTGAARATILGEAASWAASVSYPPIIGEAAFRPWKSALMRLQGRANALRLSASESPQQRAHQVVLVNGGSQQGYLLSTRGWLPGTGLQDGMSITIGEDLHAVVGDTGVAGADGVLAIAVMPLLAEEIQDGTRVEVNRPWGLMRLAQDQQGWKVGKGQVYTVAFDCESV